MWFVSTQPLYGTSMPGAGAVHHIKERTRYPRERAARGAGANGADGVIK